MFSSEIKKISLTIFKLSQPGFSFGDHYMYFGVKFTVKFRYSEKATKFEEISLIVLIFEATKQYQN